MNAKHILYLLTACGLFCFLYSPAQLYFLSDDWDSLLFSLHFKNVLHSYRPLSDASLSLDSAMWKLNATGFHVTNLFLHFACVFCVYFFSKNIFSLRSNKALVSPSSLACSVLFLFYPFHSEAVFWIVGRGAILCTLFSLLCFIFFMKKDESVGFYFTSLLCFAIALLSYEEAWIAPAIVVVLAWMETKKSKRLTLFYFAGFFVVLLFYFWVRHAFTNNVIGTPYGSARMIDFNFFRWCKNLFALLARSVVLPLQSSKLFVAVCSFVVILFIAGFIIIRKKINTALIIISVCFLLSLLPVIPLGIDTHDTESERFLYLPSVFFCVFFIQLFFLLFEKKRWLIAFVVLAEMVALRQSYDSFVISSQIARTSLLALSKINKPDTIFCSHLPAQYKGAFIFRNGFQSAVLLATHNSASHVVIVSRSEFFHPEKNYKSVFNVTSVNNRNNNNMEIEWLEDKVVLKK